MSPEHAVKKAHFKKKALFLLFFNASRKASFCPETKSFFLIFSLDFLDNCLNPFAFVSDGALNWLASKFTLQFALRRGHLAIRIQQLRPPAFSRVLAQQPKEMNVTGTTPAGRFGASKPPVFDGPAARSTSTPSGNPFASAAPVVWRGNAPATAPLGSSSSPFAQPSRPANAGVAGGGAFGYFGGSTGTIGATSFGHRQPSVHFGSPNAGFGGNAASGAAAPSQARTGWFPLGDVNSPAQPRAFGAPFADRSRPIANNAPVNPFLGSSGSRNVVGPSNPFTTFRTVDRTVSPFAPKAPAAATTNPFALGTVGSGSVQKSVFSTHQAGRKPPWTNQSTNTGGNSFDQLSTHSDIAVAVQRPFAPGWQLSTGPSSRLIPNTGIHSSSDTGFRFTATPSWPLNAGKPAQSQQPQVFSSCFAFPKPANGPWRDTKHEETPRFAFKCDSDWNITPSPLTAGSAPTGFDVKLTTAVPAIEQEPKSLVALPDVNPYGASSFGSGSLEVTVKAALSFEHALSERNKFFLSPQPEPKPSVSYANLGLPTHPINCYQLKTTRRLIGDRTSLRVASIRRAVVMRRAWTGDPISSGEQRISEARSKFSFKSSLFQALGSKENVETSSESGGKPKEDIEQQQEDEGDQLEPTPTDSKVGEQPPPSPPVNPACPILSNAKILTVPELSQLQRMSSEDLAHVDGFAIRSAEFGEIEWPGVTDVRHLNLDEILLFSESEVVVYPDEYPNKPEVGQGLNKRAILRLSHIYPSETNRKADDEGAENAAFVARLKKRTTDLRAQFLGYEAAGGVWKFEVQHF